MRKVNAALFASVITIFSSMSSDWAWADSGFNMKVILIADNYMRRAFPEFNYSERFREVDSGDELVSVTYRLKYDPEISGEIRFTTTPTIEIEKTNWTVIRVSWQQ